MAGEPPRRPGRASLRHFRASPVPLFPTNCIGACPGCASSPLRRFACRELLEFYRGPETHRRGPLLPVIEDVPIPKGLSPALLARLEHVIQQQFPLQWPEEALLSSLGETVSFFCLCSPARTALPGRPGRSGAYIGFAPLTPVDQSGRGVPPVKGHVQRQEREVTDQPFSHRPVHHRPGEQSSRP